MPSVFVMMGIPGSGKSHQAVLFGGDVICPDAYRGMLTGDESNQTDMRDQVWAAAHGYLAHLLAVQIQKEREGVPTTPVVFDATNLSEFGRQQVLKVCKHFNATAMLIVMDTPFAVCMERNAARERVVPDTAMYRMQRQFDDAQAQIKSESWDQIVFMG